MSSSCNLLLLGETGVGKSTFINGFANYSKYKTLEEAEKGGLVHLVGSTFNITDSKHESKPIIVGCDRNESFQEGQSQTQSCKAYIFRYNGNFIRLIDTPGIGDTRGLDQDRKNSENVLAFISHYPVLHGILIFLKANHSRLDSSFRFCIKELLSHLHKSASDNIVFVFTNSRGTSFRMGDTIHPLSKLLEEIKTSNRIEIPLTKNRTYYIDNEGFRYIAAVKHGIKLPAEDLADCAKSWQASLATCNRLVDYILSLNPHSVLETVSINDARRMIIAFTKPLGDVSQLILVNISMIKEQSEKIARAADKHQNLTDVLLVPKIVIETAPCKEPITVCTSPSCVEVLDDGGVPFIAYTKHCHDPCYLKNVSANITKNEDIRNCEAMDLGCLTQKVMPEETCFHCKCSWKTHMHIYSKTTQSVIYEKDTRVEKSLETAESEIERTRRLLAELENRGAILEMEKKEITKISAIFANFLHKNALTPYNDAINDYMGHLIEVEKEKIERRKGTHQVLKQLIEMLRAYQEEKAILEKELKNVGSGNQDITAIQIQEYTRELFNLPIHGPILKKMVLEIQDAARKEHENFTEIIA